MSEQERERFAQLERDLAAARETIVALKRRAEVQIDQGLDDHTALQKVMSGLHETIELKSRALEASDARYRALFDHSPSLVFTVDLDGRILNGNQQARVRLGKEARQLSGREITRLFEQDSARRLAELLQHGSGAADGLSFEDGRLQDVTVAPVPGFPLMQVLLRDVTEQRAVEEQLRHSQKMQAVGQLAGGVAHDFNNYLCGIIRHLELLRGSEDLAYREECVERILNSSKRAGELVSGLLAFSRCGRVLTEPTDLNERVRQVVGIVERTIDPRIQIELDLEEEAGEVSGDASQLESVIMNLALNARDAMPEGGLLLLRSRSLQLGARECRRLAEQELTPGNYVELCVIDDGAGMVPEVLERAFEPFFTTKPVGEGTGLGLAAVYGTVQAHGGVVQVRSQVGEGTSVRILLPRIEEVRSEAPPDSASVGEGRSLRLLVVDDEEMIRDSLALILSRLGHRVVTVRGGAEAMRWVREDGEGFDLVLLDLVLPGIGGEEVLRQLRQHAPEQRVLLMSGRHLALDQPEDSLGADAQLAKPFDSSQLLEAIERALGARREVSP